MEVERRFLQAQQQWFMDKVSQSYPELTQQSRLAGN
jgi:hypothetical protein